MVGVEGEVVRVSVSTQNLAKSLILYFNILYVYVITLWKLLCMLGYDPPSLAKIRKQ